MASCLGDQKEVQNKWFLIGSQKLYDITKAFHNQMQICHGEEIYFFKTNSTVSIHSPMHMMLESLENLTLWMAQRCFRLSFVSLWKKTLQMAKKLVKMIRCSSVGICSDAWYHICQKNWLFSLGQNPFNLCQLIFVFLTVYCDNTD